MQEEGHKIKDMLSNPKAMRMVQEEWNAYNSATNCHVCDKSLYRDSVCDHGHISVKYQGQPTNACNLKLWLNPKTTTIPKVFHNLQDFHLLMQAISKLGGPHLLIPQTTEKYISLSQVKLCFTDSTQFLLTSLDKLGMAGQPEAFKITAEYEPTKEMWPIKTSISLWCLSIAQDPETHASRAMILESPPSIFSIATPTIFMDGQWSSPSK